jgi:hypothetical protein
LPISSAASLDLPQRQPPIDGTGFSRWFKIYWVRIAGGTDPGPVGRGVQREASFFVVTGMIVDEIIVQLLLA